MYLLFFLLQCPTGWCSMSRVSNWVKWNILDEMKYDEMNIQHPWWIWSVLSCLGRLWMNRSLVVQETRLGKSVRVFLILYDTYSMMSGGRENIELCNQRRQTKANQQREELKLDWSKLDHFLPTLVACGYAYFLSLKALEAGAFFPESSILKECWEF